MVPRRPLLSFSMKLRPSFCFVKDKIYVLCDVQKMAHVAWVETILLVRCVTCHDGCSVSETDPFKLNNRANKMTSIVRCHSPSVAKIKFVINLCAVFKKERSLSFLAVALWIISRT